VFTGNEATEYGIRHEPDALAAYCRQTDRDVEQVGFMVHPTIDWMGGSPDGLVIDRVVEFKCPFSGEVYEDVPSHYMAQVQGLMQVTDLPRCDLAVWTPDRLRVFTIERSADYWRWMYPKLAEFWTYVQASVEPPRAKKSSFDYTALVEGVKDYQLS
jgi:hypothetical protein